MANNTNNKKERLQSLNQDVLAVKQPTSAASGEQAGAGDKAGKARGSPNQNQPSAGSGGAGTGLLVTVAILALLLLAAIAAGVWYALYMQDQLDSRGTDPATRIEARLAPVQQRLNRIESRLATLDRQDGGAEIPSGLAATVQDLKGQVAQQATAMDRMQDRISTSLQKSNNARDSAGQAEQTASALQSRIADNSQQLGARSDQIDKLAGRVDAMGSEPGEQDMSSQVQHLNGRVEKLSNDIKSIYRILENR